MWYSLEIRPLCGYNTYTDNTFKGGGYSPLSCVLTMRWKSEISHCVMQMIRSYVCLPLCHLYRTITKQFAHPKHRHAIHYEPTGEAMTKVLKVQVADPSTPTGWLKRCLNVFHPVTYFFPRSHSNVKKYLRGFPTYFVSEMPPSNQDWSRLFTDCNHLRITTIRLFQ